MTRPGAAVTWGMAWPRIRFGTLPMVVLVAVAVFCASCGGSPSATGGSSTTSSVRSTTTSTNAQASGVLAAYRAEQAAFEQAVQQADPTSPALAQTMTGAQLDSVRRSLVADQTNGIVGRGNVQLNPRSCRCTATRRWSWTAAFSSIELVYSATGKPVPPVTPPQHDRRPGPTSTQVSPGVWKVSDQTRHRRESCPSGLLTTRPRSSGSITVVLWTDAGAWRAVRDRGTRTSASATASGGTISVGATNDSMDAARRLPVGAAKPG